MERRRSHRGFFWPMGPIALVFFAHQPVYRYTQHTGKHHQLIVCDEAVSSLDFADCLPLYGDTIDLHTGSQIGLGEAHGSSGLMNPIPRNVFLSPKVVDFQGITSKLP